eukprot:1852872-Alexandrium_andersonii.AAC.1
MSPLARGSDRTCCRVVRVACGQATYATAGGFDRLHWPPFFPGPLAPGRMQRSAQRRVALLEARGSKNAHF